MFNQKVQQIINELAANYHPEKIILFGSYVTGLAHKDSDVDIVVVKKTNKNFYERINDASSSVKHILPLDILVYTPEEFKQMSVNNFFVINEILKNGKIVYG